jgi:hypothetical protein
MADAFRNVEAATLATEQPRGIPGVGENTFKNFSGGRISPLALFALVVVLHYRSLFPARDHPTLCRFST